MLRTAALLSLLAVMQANDVRAAHPLPKPALVGSNLASSDNLQSSAAASSSSAASPNSKTSASIFDSSADEKSSKAVSSAATPNSATASTSGSSDYGASSAAMPSSSGADSNSSDNSTSITTSFTTSMMKSMTTSVTASTVGSSDKGESSNVVPSSSDADSNSGSAGSASSASGPAVPSIPVPPRFASFGPEAGDETVPRHFQEISGRPLPLAINLLGSTALTPFVVSTGTIPFGQNHTARTPQSPPLKSGGYPMLAVLFSHFDTTFTPDPRAELQSNTVYYRLAKRDEARKLAKASGGGARGMDATATGALIATWFGMLRHNWEYSRKFPSSAQVIIFFDGTANSWDGKGVPPALSDLGRTVIVMRFAGRQLDGFAFGAGFGTGVRKSENAVCRLSPSSFAFNPAACDSVLLPYYNDNKMLSGLMSLVGTDVAVDGDFIFLASAAASPSALHVPNFAPFGPAASDKELRRGDYVSSGGLDVAFNLLGRTVAKPVVDLDGYIGFGPLASHTPHSPQDLPLTSPLLGILWADWDTTTEIPAPTGMPPANQVYYRVETDGSKLKGLAKGTSLAASVTTALVVTWYAAVSHRSENPEHLKAPASGQLVLLGSGANKLYGGKIPDLGTLGETVAVLRYAGAQSVTELLGAAVSNGMFHDSACVCRMANFSAVPDPRECDTIALPFYSSAKMLPAIAREKMGSTSNAGELVLPLSRPVGAPEPSCQPTPPPTGSPTDAPTPAPTNSPTPPPPVPPSWFAPFGPDSGDTTLPIDKVESDPLPIAVNMMGKAAVHPRIHEYGVMPFESLRSPIGNGPSVYRMKNISFISGLWSEFTRDAPMDPVGHPARNNIFYRMAPAAEARKIATACGFRCGSMPTEATGAVVATWYDMYWKKRVEYDTDAGPVSAQLVLLFSGTHNHVTGDSVAAEDLDTLGDTFLIMRYTGNVSDRTEFSSYISSGMPLGKQEMCWLGEGNLNFDPEVCATVLLPEFRQSGVLEMLMGLKQPGSSQQGEFVFRLSASPSKRAQKPPHFAPFGPEAGDGQLRRGVDQRSEAYRYGFNVLGRVMVLPYVSVNGYVGFDKSIPSGPVPLPVRHGIVAPLWGRFNTTEPLPATPVANQVYHRMVTNHDELQKLAEGTSMTSPTGALVVTWWDLVSAESATVSRAAPSSAQLVMLFNGANHLYFPSLVPNIKSLATTKVYLRYHGAQPFGVRLGAVVSNGASNQDACPCNMGPTTVSFDPKLCDSVALPFYNTGAMVSQLASLSQPARSLRRGEFLFTVSRFWRDLPPSCGTTSAPKPSPKPIPSLPRPGRFSPFGPDAGDTSMDVAHGSRHSKETLRFAANIFSKAAALPVICDDGFISFGGDTSWIVRTPQRPPFIKGVPSIAVLWGDFSPGTTPAPSEWERRVYYRIAGASEARQLADGYSVVMQFQATAALVVTWYRMVQSQGDKDTAPVSAQLVLIANGEKNTWTESQAKPAIEQLGSTVAIMRYDGQAHVIAGAAIDSGMEEEQCQCRMGHDVDFLNSWNCDTLELPGYGTFDATQELSTATTSKNGYPGDLFFSVARPAGYEGACGKKELPPTRVPNFAAFGNVALDLQLAPGDSSSTTIPFAANVFGESVTTMTIGTDGTVAFDAPGPLTGAPVTKPPFLANGKPSIAVMWADFDTTVRPAPVKIGNYSVNPNTVYHRTVSGEQARWLAAGVLDSRRAARIETAVVVTWFDMALYPASKYIKDNLPSAQLVLLVDDGDAWKFRNVWAVLRYAGPPPPTLMVGAAMDGGLASSCTCDLGTDLNFSIYGCDAAVLPFYRTGEFQFLQNIKQEHDGVDRPRGEFVLPVSRTHRRAAACRATTPSPGGYVPVPTGTQAPWHSPMCGLRGELTAYRPRLVLMMTREFAPEVLDLLKTVLCAAHSDLRLLASAPVNYSSRAAATDVASFVVVVTDVNCYEGKGTCDPSVVYRMKWLDEFFDEVRGQARTFGVISAIYSQDVPPPHARRAVVPSAAATSFFAHKGAAIASGLIGIIAFLVAAATGVAVVCVVRRRLNETASPHESIAVTAGLASGPSSNVKVSDANILAGAQALLVESFPVVPGQDGMKEAAALPPQVAEHVRFEDRSELERNALPVITPVQRSSPRRDSVSDVEMVSTDL